jgi:hypothetical protein
MTLTPIVKTRRYYMKKILSLMLGLSMILGTAAFAEDKKPADSTASKEKKQKKAKKSKTDTATTTTTDKK